MSVKKGGKTIAGATQYHPDLFDFKRSDHILNDAQWLMADTFSWQYGSMYKVAYPHLAADIVGKTLQNETVAGITVQFYLADDGHKICPASEEDNVLSIYNKTGNAWYYIIDTINQRFKLPRTKLGFTGLFSKVGDHISGLQGTGYPKISADNKITVAPDIDYTLTDDCWVWWGNTAYPGIRDFYVNGVGIGHSYGAYGAWEEYNSILIPLKAGNTIRHTGSNSTCYIYPTDSNGTEKTQTYLYFYVGAFTQTSLENIASIATETLNNKMDIGTPLARDIFSPDEWVGGAAENILSAGVGSGTITFTKNWQEYDYLWFSAVSDSSDGLDDSPHWVSVKWLLSRAAAGETNLAIIRYASGAYWYVNPQTWTETTMPVGSVQENLYINRVYAIKLKNITAENVGYLNYVGNFATVAALNAATPSAMGQWAIVDTDENHGNLQTKYFSTKNVSGQFVWSYGGVINVSLAGADYVVERQEPTAGNNYTWYRKYKSGWVEQGGWFLGTASGVAKTITLPIEMIDTNYSGYGIVSCNNAGDSGNANSFRTTFIPTSTTQITLSQTNGWRTNWQVSGMAA